MDRYKEVTYKQPRSKCNQRGCVNEQIICVKSILLTGIQPECVNTLWIVNHSVFENMYCDTLMTFNIIQYRIKCRLAWQELHKRIMKTDGQEDK